MVGAIASFLAVAAAMYFTRRIDWYGSLPQKDAAEMQAPSVAPGETV
jgi:inner membrane protein